MGTTYKRILLKLSGEALKGDETGLYHYEAVDEICKAIDECCKMGVQVAVVVGAGVFSSSVGACASRAEGVTALLSGSPLRR